MPDKETIDKIIENPYIEVKILRKNCSDHIYDSLLKDLSEIKKLNKKNVKEIKRTSKIK